MVAAAVVCFSYAASAAPLGFSGVQHGPNTLQLVKDDRHSKGHHHAKSKNHGPDKKAGHKHDTGPKYKPGHKYDKAPKNWKRHGKRPSDWQRRGCVVVGPVWFCP
ncbi:hypothetical protein [Hyphomicrobium sp. D-2]|uniref:hypothetical protein n=1 Tax=Hyphomicrobium sp. D-2 TaxID=3041621 RepID=UPI002458A4CF|nr:hypothetical protein [Hyphomicrobium sp. D-2]MDH4983451.1 hypothetical protein [Hyphomicrobium sp. D-2]